MEGREDNFMYAHLASKRRRVRKSEGATWTQDTTLVETRDTGLLCKECHKRIKWKDLDCVYEMQGSDLVRMWVCGYCDTVVQTDNMSDRQLRKELTTWDQELEVGITISGQPHSTEQSEQGPVTERSS